MIKACKKIKPMVETSLKPAHTRYNTMPLFQIKSLQTMESHFEVANLDILTIKCKKGCCGNKRNSENLQTVVKHNSSSTKFKRHCCVFSGKTGRTHQDDHPFARFRRKANQQDSSEVFQQAVQRQREDFRLQRLAGDGYDASGGEGSDRFPTRIVGRLTTNWSNFLFK